MARDDEWVRTLVVLERGSDWPDWLGPLHSASGRVISQGERESPRQLARRVARSVERWVRQGEALGVAILGCNDRFDDPAFGARADMARSLLAALRHRKGRLHLTASARHSGRSHHALSEFARGLAEQWEGRGVHVSARFGGHGATRLGRQLGPVGEVLRVA